MNYPPLPGLSPGSFLKTAAQKGRVMFANGDEYIRPIEDLRIDYELVGAIGLPSGQIVVADMHGMGDMVPQARRVKPGSYDCEVVTATYPDASKRIAMAVLRVSNKPAVRFASATRKGEAPTNEPGDCAGIGIDSAAVGFGDAKLADTSWGTDPRQDDALDDQLSTRLACIHVLPERPDLPFLLCQSGYGDGVYAVMWGLSADGEAACLLVDFEVVDWVIVPMPPERSWMDRLRSWFTKG